MATPWYCPKAIVNGASVIRSGLRQTWTGNRSATPVPEYAVANRTWWAETAINVKKATTTCRVVKDARVVIATRSGRTTKPATCIPVSVIADQELRGNCFYTPRNVLQCSVSFADCVAIIARQGNTVFPRKVAKNVNVTTSDLRIYSVTQLDNALVSTMWKAVDVTVARKTNTTDIEDVLVSFVPRLFFFYCN